jgi:hypothetical protein
MRGQIGPLLVAALVAIGGLPPRVIARPVPQPQLSWATEPALAWPGDQALVCAVNLAPANSAAGQC